jgi:alkanesulfonate monooxygenase SsuD/methylene tetrahydromethanopterin reductase-like flavin-dependent oxidoreductase (luciferase family)
MPGSVRIGFKTSPQEVDWPTLDATWAAAGELGAFESGWMNDHLVHQDRERGGPSYEALSLMAALAHRVPGLWLGHAVLSNTFRHPVMLAKAATVLDNVTGGRFIVGLGAGWHEGEHVPFGIDMPPIGERIDRLRSAVTVLKALFSPAAAKLPGVDLDDRFYPLRGATNEPPPLRAGGPPIWLGGQKPRGLKLAGELGDGWLLPAGGEGVAVFGERRDAILGAMLARGRDPAGFSFAAQVSTGESAADRRAALALARTFVDAGATDIILGMPARLGPDGLRRVAREVAEPLREAIG